MNTPVAPSPVPQKPVNETNIDQIHKKGETVATRSLSKNMDTMVSNYEEDLRKIEAMKQ